MKNINTLRKIIPFKVKNFYDLNSLISTSEELRETLMFYPPEINREIFENTEWETPDEFSLEDFYASIYYLKKNIFTEDDAFEEDLDLKKDIVLDILSKHHQSKSLDLYNLFKYLGVGDDDIFLISLIMKSHLLYIKTYSEKFPDDFVFDTDQDSKKIYSRKSATQKFKFHSLYNGHIPEFFYTAKELGIISTDEFRIKENSYFKPLFFKPFISQTLFFNSFEIFYEIYKTNNKDKKIKEKVQKLYETGNDDPFLYYETIKNGTIDDFIKNEETIKNFDDYEFFMDEEFSKIYTNLLNDRNNYIKLIKYFMLKKSPGYNNGHLMYDKLKNVKGDDLKFLCTSFRCIGGLRRMNVISDRNISEFFKRFEKLDKTEGEIFAAYYCLHYMYIEENKPKNIDIINCISAEDFLAINFIHDWFPVFQIKDEPSHNRFDIFPIDYSESRYMIFNNFYSKDIFLKNVFRCVKLPLNLYQLTFIEKERLFFQKKYGEEKPHENSGDDSDNDIAIKRENVMYPGDDFKELCKYLNMKNYSVDNINFLHTCYINTNKFGFEPNQKYFDVIFSLSAEKKFDPRIEFTKEYMIDKCIEIGNASLKNFYTILNDSKYNNFFSSLDRNKKSQTFINFVFSNYKYLYELYNLDNTIFMKIKDEHIEKCKTLIKNGTLKGTFMSKLIEGDKSMKSFSYLDMIGKK